MALLPTIMRKVLFKAFVFPFYRAFLGFFLLVMIAFGVFMEFKQHLLIAERIVEHDKFFYVVLLVFFGYCEVQKRFQFRLLEEVQYRVFHQLGFITFRELTWKFFPIWLTNHAIIFIYGLLLSYAAFEKKDVGKLLMLWCFFLIIFVISSVQTYYKLKKPFPDFVRFRSKLLRNLSFEYWFLIYLKEKKPLSLLGVKFISLILMNGFFYTFLAGRYDIRWLEFGILCVSFVHFPILLEKYSFESGLSYFHSMPLSLGWKLRHHFKTIILILSPEIIFLIYKFGGKENMGNLFLLFLLLLAINLGIYGLIKFRNGLIKSLRSAYFTFFILFLAVILGVPPLFISVFCLIPFFVTVRSRFSV